MEVAEIERDLLEQANNVAILGECFAYMQRYDECIERLEECIRAKLPRLSIRNRQSLITRIEQLEREKIQLQRRFLHFGDDYTSTSSSDVEKLVWREIVTAFENCIMTGTVINFKHIEPCQFLEDAREIVLERVRTVMTKYDDIKINTMFNDEFVADDQ